MFQCECTPFSPPVTISLSTLDRAELERSAGYWRLWVLFLLRTFLLFSHFPLCTFTERHGKDCLWNFKILMDFPYLFFFSSTELYSSQTPLWNEPNNKHYSNRYPWKLQSICRVCTDILAFECFSDCSIFRLWVICFDCRAANQGAMKMWLKDAGLWSGVRQQREYGSCCDHWAPCPEIRPIKKLRPLR